MNTSRDRSLKARLLLSLAWLLVGFTGGNAAANKPQMTIQSEDNALEITLKVTVPYSREDVWKLIRDYENLSQYMPNVDSSVVVARTDSSQLVRQVVTTRVLLPWTFRLQFEFVQDAEERLRFRMLEGNLRSYEGSWQVEALEDSSSITYWARVTHRLPLPNFLLRYVVHMQMSQMMPALVVELDRQAETGP